MLKKKKLCSCGCGKEGYIWSQGMLRECFLRLNPPKKIVYKSAKQKIKDVDKAEKSKQLHELFLEIWKERRKEDEKGYYVDCFETGQRMYQKYFMYNTCIYSHYYPKSRYPEYAMMKWNIEIVHPDTHAQWESDHEKCPKMNERFKSLLTQT